MVKNKLDKIKCPKCGVLIIVNKSSLFISKKTIKELFYEEQFRGLRGYDEGCIAFAERLIKKIKGE